MAAVVVVESAVVAAAVVDAFSIAVETWQRRAAQTATILKKFACPLLSII
jgi:hypothetical protein